MKKLITPLFALLLALPSFASGEDPEPKTATVNTSESELRWKASKVTGSHNGIVPISSGSITLENDLVTSAAIVMDMSSLVVEDIKDAETNAKLTGHLKSDDFFSTEKHPTCRFELTKFTPKKGSALNNYEITGILTIKGISQEITFPAIVAVKDGMVRAKADFTIDRTKWDIRYNSGSFFDGLGDYMIYDDVNIGFDLVAKVN